MPKVWNGRYTTGFGRGARSRRAGALACGLVCCLAYLVRAQELPPRAAQELRRALQHFERGEYDSSLRILEPLEATYPANSDIEHLLAITLDLSGKPVEANRHFKRVVELNPNSAGARANLGTSLVRIGNAEAAIAEFRLALKIEPGNATANYNLGTLLLRQRKLREALPFLDKAYSIQPGVYENGYHLALCRFVLGEHKGAQAVLDSMQPVPRERTEFYLILALNRNASGRKGEAEKSLQEVLPLLATHPEAHEQVAMLLFSQGMFREALPVLEAAAGRFPQSEGAWTNLARAEYRTGKLDEARLHAERALTVKPSGEGHVLLADILEALNQPLAAIAHYQQAVEIDPSEDNLIALGYELLSHWNWTEAQDLFASGSKKFSKSWRMRAGLGAAYLGQGENEEATQHLLQAIALAPDEPLGYQLLADSFPESTGSFDQAVSRFHAFYKSRPGEPRAIYYHILAARRSSSRYNTPLDYAACTGLLRKAIARSPDFWEAQFLLGEMLFSQQGWQEAIVAYEEAIRHFPDHLEAHYKLGLSLQRVGESERARSELKLYQDLKEKQGEAAARRIAQSAKFLVTPRK